MYILIYLIALAASVGLFSFGLRRRSIPIAAAGAILAIAVIAFFSTLSLWGEALWFYALGYPQRFWTALLSRIGLSAVAVVGSALVVWALTVGLSPRAQSARRIAVVVAAFFAALWGQTHWEAYLQFTHAVDAGLQDPIFQKDTGFYLFRLPFYAALLQLAVMIVLVSIATCLASLGSQFRVTTQGRVEIRETARDGRSPIPPVFFVAVATLFFVAAVAFYLGRFSLMYSTEGVVHGPGWTDIHLRLPAFAVMIALSALAGVLVLLAPARRRIGAFLKGTPVPSEYRAALVPLALGAVLFLVWFVSLRALPGLFQSFRVEPNEITLEKPYIEHNIEFTRHGFKLDSAEEREFPATGDFTRSMVQSDKGLFSNIRLWDYRALDSVYKQFQEIRLYYEFRDVDVDRYAIDGHYRQVMVSAREMNTDNLTAQSQTFVNRRFTYTHGYGITLTTVNDFTPEGLPNLLVRDIPPKSKYPSLEIAEPRIYYGELTRDPVVANSSEEEFDYPRGDKNIYTRYAGTGGVQLSSFWRKFLFGWKFDGTRFLLSGYPTRQSRILFHRSIRERVHTLAPFLTLDKDPYIVLAGGRLYWMLDAYTASDRYPYSEPYYSAVARAPLPHRPLPRRGQSPNPASINYIRNSVKIVVDAYNGSVDFYIFDPDDSIVRVYDGIFPGLFKTADQMPEELRKHIRYPADMLLVQGMVYAKYHMDDPTVFYNQEDLWVRATEKYYSRVQPVEPYYIMWEQPDSRDLQYILMMPFTPKNRQVLIGWIAGMCDPGNYGRFLAYRFPKDRRVLGTQQVETKIDQDSYLSGKLTLWDQRGSNVIRGNVLVIPVKDTLIYVEPIYLRAETAAYPELRLVAIMHDDTLAYAETFDKALMKLFGEEVTDAAPESLPVAAPSAPGDKNALIRQASDAFNRYIDATSRKQFQDAARALEQLEQSLKELDATTTKPEPPQK